MDAFNIVLVRELAELEVPALNNNNNNNSQEDDICSAVMMTTRSLREFTRSFDECRTAPSGRRPSD